MRELPGWWERGLPCQGEGREEGSRTHFLWRDRRLRTGILHWKYLIWNTGKYFKQRNRNSWALTDGRDLDWFVILNIKNTRPGEVDSIMIFNILIKFKCWYLIHSRCRLLTPIIIASQTVLQDLSLSLSLLLAARNSRWVSIVQRPNVWTSTEVCS